MCITAIMITMDALESFKEWKVPPIISSRSPLALSDCAEAAQSKRVQHSGGLNQSKPAPDQALSAPPNALS